jgi:hypothetical protein
VRPILVLLLATSCGSAGDTVLARVAAHADHFGAISRQIWETPELGFHETKSSALLQQEMRTDVIGSRGVWFRNSNVEAVSSP